MNNIKGLRENKDGSKYLDISVDYGGGDLPDPYAAADIDQERDKK